VARPNRSSGEFIVCRTVLIGLVRPFGHKFKVTTKGISTTKATVQWALLWRFAVMALLTVFGLLLQFTRFSPRHGAQGYALNIVWSLLNTAILALACAVCIEPPKRRHEERFKTREEGLIRLNDGTEFLCTLQNISVSGAAALREQGWQDLADSATLILDHGHITAPFTVVRHIGSHVGLKFQLTPQSRRALRVKLFTGEYHHEIEVVKALQVFGSLARLSSRMCYPDIECYSGIALTRNGALPRDPVAMPSLPDRYRRTGPHSWRPSPRR